MFNLFNVELSSMSDVIVMYRPGCGSVSCTGSAASQGGCEPCGGQMCGGTCGGSMQGGTK